MRDDVLMDLVQRARADREFKQKARRDLEGTLGEYGYELNPEEMEAVKTFQRDTQGMSETQLDRELSTRASAQRGV